MLAYLIKEPFDKEGWIFEVKWDGFRAIAEIEDKQVLLYSRNFLSFNERFPLIAKELEKLKVKSAVLDGEIVILDSKGKSQFQLMQNYQKTLEGDLFYYVFDALCINGEDLRHLPLMQRRSKLKDLLTKSKLSHVRFSDHVEENGIEYFKLAEKLNLEGIIAKNGESSYQMKRSRDWLKIKTHMRQEVVIAGFTEPKGSRERFGALIVGVYEEGSLIYSGRVGGGFTRKVLDDVYKELHGRIQKTCSLKNPPKNMKDITWVRPELIAEVSFAEWTHEGIMRQPIFLGLRFDKNPKTIHREKIING